MREIKFRAWSEIESMMVTWPTFKASPGFLGRCQTGKVKYYKLMQYTGLKDKNGVEIYEGDIVSYWDGTLTTDVNGETPCPYGSPLRYTKSKNKFKQIVFNKQSFRVEDNNPLGSRYFCSEDIEIIGNIYENPELLEE